MTGARRVFGLHAVSAALAYTPDKVTAAWVEHRRQDRRSSALRKRLEELGVAVEPVEKRLLDRMAEGQKHQGVVLEIQLPEELTEQELVQAIRNTSEAPFYLILDQVQDPHNLGACLRTADGAGAHGVIITKDRATGLTPTVYKVACGAAESVPLYTVTNLGRTIRGLKRDGLWIIGAEGGQTRSAFDTDLSQAVALVIGAEHQGLRHKTRDLCDVLVSLPMFGRVESLNVSVAAGVMLYEAVRQRRRLGAGQSNGGAD